MNIRIITTSSLALALMSANAQTTFLDDLRKIEDGKGKIVVMQSPEIDALVNGKPRTATNAEPSSVSASRDKSATKTPITERIPAATPSATTPGSSTSTAKNTEEETSYVVDTRKKVMRNSYKTTGFRIQVFSGGNTREDKKKAEQAGNAMKMHFPSEPIYVHFYSPSWKCRMGNYRDFDEAKAILAQVKALGYKQACIVKGTISVQY